jgi:hypothetical protein
VLRSSWAGLLLTRPSALFSQDCNANAIEEIANLFDRCPIVSLGAAHGATREFEFLRNLMSDRSFSSRCNDIVVEFGNSLYQPLLDRYMEGEDVPIADLQQVWRPSWALGTRPSIGISSRLCEPSTRADPRPEDSVSLRVTPRSTGRKFNLATTIKSSRATQVWALSSCMKYCPRNERRC